MEISSTKYETRTEEVRHMHACRLYVYLLFDIIHMLDRVTWQCYTTHITTPFLKNRSRNQIVLVVARLSLVIDNLVCVDYTIIIVKRNNLSLSSSSSIHRVHSLWHVCQSFANKKKEVQCAISQILVQQTTILPLSLSLSLYIYMCR